MEQLKRKRSSQAGNMTRIFHKLQRLQAEDSACLNLQLEKHLAGINAANDAYQQWHAAIEEQFVDQIDTTEEDETLSQHMDACEEAEALAQHLINVSTAMSTALFLSLRKQMTKVDTLMTDTPDKSFNQTIADIKQEFKLLETILQRSQPSPGS